MRLPKRSPSPAKRSSAAYSRTRAALGATATRAVALVLVILICHACGGDPPQSGGSPEGDGAAAGSGGQIGAAGNAGASGGAGGAGSGGGGAGGVAVDGGAGAGGIGIDAGSGSAGTAGQDDGGSAAGAGGSGDDGQLPPASKTTSVSDCATLKTALAKAEPGEHVVADDTIYDCDITLDRTGVVLRSSSLLGATLKGEVTIKGNDNILYGVKMHSIGGVNVGGVGNRILRNQFRGWGHPAAIHMSKGSGAQIGYNEFSDPCPWSNTSCGTSNYPLRIGIRTAEDGQADFHYDARVYRNYFHDFPPKPDPSNYHSGQDDAMEVCETHGPAYVNLQTGWVVEYNLIENHLQGHGVMDFKCGGNTVQFNTMLNCPGGRMDQRNGSYSAFLGNWLENTGGSTIHGRGHRILGNRMINTGGMGIMAADGEWDAPTNAVKQRAVDVLLAGNELDKLVIGKSYSPATDVFPALNTRVEAHEGAPPVLDVEQNTTIVATTNETVPTAIKLSPADVGPLAP